MARLLKIFFGILAGVVGIVVIAAVALFLFFDPNDFRDRISAGVKAETGRDLVIDGDLSLSLFPWLAVNIGHTELGNAPGFSDARFMSFEQAHLSVRLMPLIFQQQVKVGTASLDGLVVNLEVASNGATNWDDLAEGGSDTSAPRETDSADTPVIDVANIKVTDASVKYRDGQTGSAYTINNLGFDTSRIVADTPITMSAEFDFAATPGELGGHLAIRGTSTMSDGASQLSVSGLNITGTIRGLVAQPTEINFDAREINVDTRAQSVNAGEMDLSVLGLSMAAEFEPFSYAGAPVPKASLRVAEFSLKDLMRLLELEPPVTANPNALQRVSFSADAVVTDSAIALSAMTLDFDDSAMTGNLSVPTTDSGSLEFDLSVNTIVLDDYMAPAVEDSNSNADAAVDDIEIPVDLIRTLNAYGSFRIDQATLSGMEFENVVLGLNASGGNLRLYPLTADFYNGSYSGDVRVDASGDQPRVSVNEKIDSVNLASMSLAMFDQDNITGSINGEFVLSGSGQTLAAIRRDLDGNLALELADGAWEGTDVWHELRKARALFRQETPPEPSLPARTEFSSVTATGVVAGGIFQNDDFLAELPFLRLTGAGSVDLTTTEVDYELQVRVLDRPEFMAGATEAEMTDFTATVVPLKITGPMSAPKIRPDIGGIFRGRVEDAIEDKKQEIKDRLLNRLLGGSDEEPAEGDARDDAADEEPQDLEDKLKKDLLDKLFQR